MAIQPGTSLGPYEIVASIGAGGMGEVWKARDPRIGRDVAIKVLPAEFLRDRDRLERFEKEARAAGGLNHPNLVTIYDIGEAEGAPYIVMELLEGETLMERMAITHDSQSSVRVSVRRATDWASQMASGLAAAHDAGIVHRDLKPANVFLTRDGRIKILDFGLAKIEMGDAGPDEATLAKQTDPGVVLGTAAYMSPEQVRGGRVDQRSDIFSLGLILYEVLTGRRAFARDTRAELMTAILKEDVPSIESIAPHVPLSLVRIVDHCIEKNPEQRFQTARDLAFNLESITTSTGAAPIKAGIWRSSFGFGGLVLAVVVGAVLGFLVGRFSGPKASREVAKPVTSAALTATWPLTFSGRDQGPAISPDGSLVAFQSNRGGTSRIWLKQVGGGGELVLTPGPDYAPRFSPDGSTILFTRDEGDNRFSVYRVPILGGESRKLVDGAGYADWSRDGTRIAFIRQTTEAGRVTSSVWIANSDGSGEKKLTTAEGRVLVAPRWSPDSKRLLVSDNAFGNYANPPFVIDVDSEQSKVIDAVGKSTIFSTTAWVDDDRILVAAVPIGTNFVSGAGSVVDLVDVGSGAVTPLFRTQAPIVTLDLDRKNRVVFDQVPLRQNLREVDVSTGREGRWLTRGQAIDRQPAFSPDGSRVVFSSNMTGNLDLSVASLDDGSIRRLTDDAADDFDPAFTADGKSILWSSKRETGHYEIWTANADGSGARRISNDGFDAENPTATPDGAWIVYDSYAPEKSGVWKVRSDGSSAERIATGSTILPEVSPDGRWVSYVDGDGALAVVSIDGGTPQKVAPIPAQTLPSINLGRSRWTHDGKGIIYLDHDDSGGTGLFVQRFEPGVDTYASRKRLVGSKESVPESFAMSPDGRRLVVSYLEPLTSVSISEPIAALQKPDGEK